MTCLSGEGTARGHTVLLTEQTRCHAAGVRRGGNRSLPEVLCGDFCSRVSKPVCKLNEGVLHASSFCSLSYGMGVHVFPGRMHCPLAQATPGQSADTPQKALSSSSCPRWSESRPARNHQPMWGLAALHRSGYSASISCIEPCIS